MALIKHLKRVSMDFAMPYLDAIHSQEAQRTTAFEFRPPEGISWPPVALRGRDVASAPGSILRLSPRRGRVPSVPQCLDEIYALSQLLATNGGIQTALGQQRLLGIDHVEIVRKSNPIALRGD
jgi:hypothetical protein